MTARFALKSGGTGRIIGNNLLVRPVPPPTRSRGGIVFVDVERAHAYAVGEVVAIGHLTGDKAPPHTPIPDIRIGDRVLYIRLLGKTDVNPRIKDLLGEGLIRIRPSDVLLMMDASDVERVQ